MMPAQIAPSQVHGPRDIAAVLTMMESVSMDRAGEVVALRAAFGAYFSTYNLPAHTLLSSELENIVRAIVVLNPALWPMACVFCEALGVRPPVLPTDW